LEVLDSSFLYIYCGYRRFRIGEKFSPKANDSDYLENTKINATTYKTDAFRNIKRYGNSLTPLALVNLPLAKPGKRSWRIILSGSRLPFES